MCGCDVAQAPFSVCWARLDSREAAKMAQTHLAGSKLRDLTISRHRVTRPKLVSTGMVLPKVGCGQNGQTFPVFSLLLCIVVTATPCHWQEAGRGQRAVRRRDKAACRSVLGKSPSSELLSL